MNKIKVFISSLELRLSDLMLLIGFLPFAIFLIFGQLYMQIHDPNELGLKVWMFVPLFIISVCAWGFYLYLEHKRNNLPNHIISWIFATITVILVLGILIQPSTLVENVVVRMVNDGNKGIYGPDIAIGDWVTAVIQISTIHKVFFALDIILIMGFVYIGLFIFPKRFKNLIFLKYLGFAVFILMFVIIFYSYFAEFDKYVNFIKYLLGKGEPGHDLDEYSVISFIIHKNAFGMCMMIGIIFAIINHAIDKKWWYYLLMAYFYISMIFSYCKTGLLISALIIFVYVLFRLITTFKEHKKRNTIFLSVIGGVIFVAIIVLGAAYLSKGKIFGSIYSVIESLTGGETLDNRMYIWDNTYQLLRDGWWIIGRGFGTYNMMILKMNAANGDFVFPAHSAYMATLAEGGILYLLWYLALLGYVGYIVIKTFKHNPTLMLAMVLGALSFIIYSTIEEIHYVIYIFMFPIMIFYNITKNKEQNA